MKRNELKLRTDSAVEQTRSALQIVYECLNDGQKKQLIKAENVKRLFDLYGVNYK